MVQLLSPEVPLEQSGFQPIAELYLFVFDHWAFVVGAGEVGEAIDCAVVFASIGLIPLYADPQFILSIGRCALMLQSTKVSHNTTTIIEQYLPSN